jgi:ribosome-binding protein aMBF1 (putative translation factor)
MARSWKQVRERAVADGLLDERRVRDARADLGDAVHAQRLADMRRQKAVRQVDLAAQMKVSQARVSKIERGDLSHTELGTLAAYVEALGGELRVIADFDGEIITVG